MVADDVSMPGTLARGILITMSTDETTARRIDDPDVYAELKQWAIAQVDEGCAVETCAQSLVESGWHAGDVADLMEEVARTAGGPRGAVGAVRSATYGFTAPNLQTAHRGGVRQAINIIESLCRLFGSRKKQ